MSLPSRCRTKSISYDRVRPGPSSVCLNPEITWYVLSPNWFWPVEWLDAPPGALDVTVNSLSNRGTLSSGAAASAEEAGAGAEVGCRQPTASARAAPATSHELRARIASPPNGAGPSLGQHVHEPLQVPDPAHLIPEVPYVPDERHRVGRGHAPGRLHRAVAPGPPLRVLRLALDHVDQGGRHGDALLGQAGDDVLGAGLRVGGHEAPDGLGLVGG